MPIKTWSAFDVITSSDVNTYLMNQALIVCTVPTRPSSPVTGMRIWQTDTDEEYIWTGSTWQLMKDVQTFVRKSVDEVKNNTTSPTRDEELFGFVRAQAIYYLDIFIFARSPSESRTVFQLECPVGTQITWTPNNYGVILSNFDHIGYDYDANLAYDTKVEFLTDGAFDTVSWMRELTIQTGNLAGTVGLKWAQMISKDDDTIVRAGSYFHLRRAVQ